MKKDSSRVGTLMCVTKMKCKDFFLHDETSDRFPRVWLVKIVCINFNDSFSIIGSIIYSWATFVRKTPPITSNTDSSTPISNSPEGMYRVILSIVVDRSSWCL